MTKFLCYTSPDMRTKLYFCTLTQKYFKEMTKFAPCPENQYQERKFSLPPGFQIVRSAKNNLEHGSHLTPFNGTKRNRSRNMNKALYCLRHPSYFLLPRFKKLSEYRTRVAKIDILISVSMATNKYAIHLGFQLSMVRMQSNAGESTTS